MRLLSMTFDENETPDRVSFDMTIEEAAYIARVLGRFTDAESCEIMRAGNRINHEIYSCLTGAVFNRFWEAGLDDFRK